MPPQSKAKSYGFRTLMGSSGSGAGNPRSTALGHASASFDDQSNVGCILHTEPVFLHPNEHRGRKDVEMKVFSLSKCRTNTPVIDHCF